MTLIAASMNNCRMIYSSDQMDSVKHRMIGLELSRAEGEVELLPLFLHKFLTNGESITRRGNQNNNACNNGHCSGI